MRTLRVGGKRVAVLEGRSSWADRFRARRSALVVAPDRATAVEFALRWQLDLARIRVMASPTPELIERELRRGGNHGEAWHSQ